MSIGISPPKSGSITAITEPSLKSAQKAPFVGTIVFTFFDNLI